MDEELKKRTIIHIIKQKFEFKNPNSDDGIVHLYEENIPQEMNISFTELANLLMHIEKENPNMVRVEAVTNINADLESFISKDPDIYRLGQQFNKAFFKIRFVNRNPTMSHLKSAVSMVESKTCFIRIPGINKKIRIGNINTRTAKLICALSDPDTGIINIKRKEHSVFDLIRIKKDGTEPKDYSAWMEITKNIVKDINKQIHKHDHSKGLTLKSDGGNFHFEHTT